MKTPLNWLKDFVSIKNENLSNLMWKMTEAGLTCESYEKFEEDIVLDVEVTANRPDWMSIIGVARDISAIEKAKFSEPKFISIPKKTKDLPISVKTDKSLSGRYTGITIANVSVKPSPKIIQQRLIQVGLRPINNLVDITNYVMFELGVPIHVFDYDKFKTKNLEMNLAKGDEEFISVDGLSYKLPKDAIIIKDKNRVVDLCGIKGGENTKIDENTKNIYIHVPIYSPALIRRTTQKLGLFSDASRIYERGADFGRNVEIIQKVVELVLKNAGGEVASDLIDLGDTEKQNKVISLSFEKLNQILGIEIEKDKVLTILNSLNLNPTVSKNVISCKIPSYRGDLIIEEDLIEEVARIYGYNKFPKTIPSGTVSIIRPPYFYYHKNDLLLKNKLVALGFNEVMNLTLVSKEILEKYFYFDESKLVKLVNPVSIDHEYLRPSLLPSLLEAVKLNQNEEKLKIFELAKTYEVRNKNFVEEYHLTGLTINTDYQEIKTVVDYLFKLFNYSSFDIKRTIVDNSIWHPNNSGIIERIDETVLTIGQLKTNQKCFAFDINLDVFYRNLRNIIIKPIPLFPPQIEDMTINIPEGVMVGKIIDLMTAQKYVEKVELTDTYERNFTFRIWYQSDTHTLTNIEVEKVREKIKKELSNKFNLT